MYNFLKTKMKQNIKLQIQTRDSPKPSRYGNFQINFCAFRPFHSRLYTYLSLDGFWEYVFICLSPKKSLTC